MYVCRNMLVCIWFFNICIYIFFFLIFPMLEIVCMYIFICVCISVFIVYIYIFVCFYVNAQRIERNYLVRVNFI